MPLADMRIAGTRHTVTQYVVAIMLTMALCGLWHGAGWNFVLWGTMHGAAIVFALGWRRVLPPPRRSSAGQQRSGFSCLAAWYSAPRASASPWNIYSGLATLPDASMLGKAWIVGVGVLLAVALPATQELCNRINLRPVAWVPAALGVIGVGLLVQLGGNESYDFIYFRF